jgi:hypothetical protein
VDEPLLGVGVPRQFGWQKLEGHGALELGVLGLVDHAHPALAEFLEDLVVGYGLANHTNSHLYARSIRK